MRRLLFIINCQIYIWHIYFQSKHFTFHYVKAFKLHTQINRNTTIVCKSLNLRSNLVSYRNIFRANKKLNLPHLPHTPQQIHVDGDVDTTHIYRVLDPGDDWNLRLGTQSAINLGKPNAVSHMKVYRITPHTHPYAHNNTYAHQHLRLV